MNKLSINSLKIIVADLLDLSVADLSLDQPFHEQGEYDSLKVVLLMASLEEDFALTVPPTEAWELNSIREIVEFAQKQEFVVED